MLVNDRTVRYVSDEDLRLSFGFIISEFTQFLSLWETDCILYLTYMNNLVGKNLNHVKIYTCINRLRVGS